MLPPLLISGLALAADEAISIREVVPIEPDQVYEVLADLERWPAIWPLAEDPTHAGGTPGSADQRLRWSTGQRARGGMRLVEADPERGIVYEVEWRVAPSLPGHPQPLGHVGRITWKPEGDGTAIRWTVDRPSSRAGRFEKRIGGAVRDAMIRMRKELELGPREHVELVERDGALIWRGMHHRWTYNHRINRSGDWLTVPECDEGCTAEQVHAAASGSGADRASFEGFASWMPGVRSWYGTIELWLDGDEGETLEETACIELPEEVGDGPVVLRGYDMDAVEAADSLWAVSVGIERKDDQVCGSAEIKMACRTPECGAEALTTYTVDLPFVVLTGDLRTDRTAVSHEQIWKAGDLRDEPVPEPIRTSFAGSPVRPAAVGIAGFGIELDAPHHTRGFDLAARPGPIGDDGQIPVELDLFYVQWGPVEMAPLTVAQFAHAGEARLDIDLVLVQPEGIGVHALDSRGTLYWPGKGADASVPIAEHRAPLSLPKR